MKLTPQLARSLAKRHGFSLGQNFFVLSASTVCQILDAADSVGYRKPKNANGSRGRYFYAYLNRAAYRVDRATLNPERP